jgi:hypothetical protein
VSAVAGDDPAKALNVLEANAACANITGRLYSASDCQELEKLRLELMKPARDFPADAEMFVGVRTSGGANKDKWAPLRRRSERGQAETDSYGHPRELVDMSGNSGLCGAGDSSPSPSSSLDHFYSIMSKAAMETNAYEATAANVMEEKRGYICELDSTKDTF